MSGEEWEDFSRRNNDRQQSNGEEADDDFGEFEGFDDVDQIGSGMAQPLPQALQASWSNFPDYVPSQRATTSALQPDLLPTQPNVDSDASGSANNSIAELDLPDVNVGNAGASVRSRQSRGLSQPPQSLPDVSPIEPGSFGNPPDLQQQDNNNNNSNFSIIQPDLADVEHLRTSHALPDVSPVGSRRPVEVAERNPSDRPYFVQAQPDLADIQQPVFSSSNSELDERGAASACNIGHPSHINSGATSPGNASVLSSNHDRRPCLVSRNNGGNDHLDSANSDVLSQIQEQITVLRYENERMMRELVEVRTRNIELVRLLSECVLVVRKWDSQPQGDQTVQQCINQLTQVVADLRVEFNQKCDELKSEFDTKIATLQSQQCGDIVQKLEEQNSTLTELKETMKTLKTSKKDSASVEDALKMEDVIQSQFQTVRHQLSSDVHKALQDLSVDSINKSGVGDGVGRIDKAVKEFESYLEEKKTKDDRSRQSLVSLIDSLLVCTRQHLQVDDPSTPNTSNFNS